ncbi:uncharacterized protein EV422DRAFT_536333 [Fimicolochytrium jonesii]|uniref:uncharacterized protein n=1 Tax=Fimicolochytrium jonesii TaxID=1396493 RepID=UPI0022FDF066|nr:uncharacterized protein EV422DRAFT_536333 [Fimicolochytrium jonesii]KAI8819018.1 hypothetical protein EV422DRAFT_536333 [Fimicolochytrium jonesii]
MGNSKLTNYRSNAVHDRLPEKGSIGMRQLFWNELGYALKDSEANAAICRFLKRRHKYYHGTSTLLPDAVNEARMSVVDYIQRHPELSNYEKDLSPSSASLDDRILQTKEEIEKEESYLSAEDDDDDFDVKRRMHHTKQGPFPELEPRGKLGQLTDRLADASIDEDTKQAKADAHQKEFPPYVPESIVGTLQRLKEGRSDYVENLIAFYKLRSEGAFAGHEDEWVLIHDQSIVRFFPSEDDIIEVVDEHPGGAFQPVNDKNLRGEKKRAVACIPGAQAEFKVPLEVRIDNLKGHATNISIEDVCFDTGCPRTTLQHHHLIQLGNPATTIVSFRGLGTGSGTCFRATVSGINPAQTKWSPKMRIDFWSEESNDECLLGFDILRHFAIASLPTAGTPSLLIASNEVALKTKLGGVHAN